MSGEVMWFVNFSPFCSTDQSQTQQTTIDRLVCGHSLAGCNKCARCLSASLFRASQCHTRNVLDCGQSNYSSRIIFSNSPTLVRNCSLISHGRHLGFDLTGKSATRSADPENPTVEPNIKWIGSPVAEISPFEIFQMRGRSVGRQ